MKKAKPKFFVVEIPVYNIDICVSFLQDQKSMIKNLRKLYNITQTNEEIMTAFPDWPNGTMGDFGVGGPLLMRINSLDDIVRTITHEVFHAVYFIAKSRGLTLSDSSEEAFSYLTGHLNSEIITTLCETLK
jgi:hypothetical protein